MRIISYIVAVLVWLCFIGGVLWGCLESVAFDANYYAGEYERLDREAVTGMTAEGLQQTTQALFDYIRGDRQNLNIQADIGGVRREVFNDTEKAHMADVQRLYRPGSTLRYVLWASGAVLLIVLAFISRRRTAKTLSKGYLIALLGAGTAAGLLGAVIAMDFDRFWQGFHRMFFTNDLWMLDPARDVLIQMFPSAFFSGMVETILLRFGTLLLVLAVIAVTVLLIKPGRRKEAF